MSEDFKLKIQMIPHDLWQKNLRSPGNLGRSRWNKLRKEALEKCGNRCVICKSRDRLQGHEIWEYDERPRSGTAKLVGIDIICRKCHDIHHWGLTIKFIKAGIIDVRRRVVLIRHFRKVNQCTEEEFEAYAASSLVTWAERSAKRWKIDWGAFAGKIAEARASRKLWHARRAA